MLVKQNEHFSNGKITIEICQKYHNWTWGKKKSKFVDESSEEVQKDDLENDSDNDDLMEESDDNEKMSEEESDIDDEDNEKKVEQT